MKRYLIFVLSLVLAFSVFASCTDKAVGDESESYAEGAEESESVDTFEPVDELIEGFEELRLVPIVIEKERFEKAILDNIDNQRDKDFLSSFYSLYDLEQFEDSIADTAYITYCIPAVKSNKIYVIKPDIVSRELEDLEEIITEYCEDYTHGHMAADYLACGYTQEDILNGVEIIRLTDFAHVPDFILDGYKVPIVIERKRFEEMCSDVLYSDSAYRIREFYTFYEKGGDYTEDGHYNKLKEEFRLIPQLDVCVLSQNVSEAELEELQRIIPLDYSDIYISYIRCGYFWEQ
ncbi:MAG: hypothetical protein IJD22_07170 [Clostridia bacterium]|nr:hypothetical protein [Clostridia bacterium]